MPDQARHTENKRPSRADLLRELESIRESLVDGSDQTPSNSNAAKTTTAMPLDDKSNSPPNPSSSSSAKAPSVSGEQQSSLFDDLPDSEPSEASNTQLENPFLPKHIKERLDHEKSFYQQDVLNAVLNNNAAQTSEVDQLVDNLVEEYLPKIEQELRLRLKSLIDKG